MEGEISSRDLPTRAARLVVIRADLDDRRVVWVEVEVVPLDGAQDLLGQGVGRLALEDEGEVHHQRLRAGLEDAERAGGGGRGGDVDVHLEPPWAGVIRRGNGMA